MIRLWELKSGAPVKILGHSPGGLNSLMFTPDGRNLAIRDDKGVAIWDVGSWRPKRFLEAPVCDLVCANAWIGCSDDGRSLAVRARGGIQLWDTAEWKPTGFISSREPESYGTFDAVTAMTGDGRLVATATESGGVELWSVPSRSRIAVLDSTVRTTSLAFSPDGRLLAAGHSDGHAELWNTDVAREIAIWTAHSSWVLGLTFSPNGAVLATGGADQLIRLWELPRMISGEMSTNPPVRLETLRGHGDQVWALSFTKDGQFLVSGSEDGTARFWHANSVLSQKEFTNWLGGFWLSHDGQTIEAVDSTGQLKVWNVVSGEPISSVRLPTQLEAITSQAISRDRRILVRATTEALSLWELPTVSSLGTLPVRHPTIRHLVFSANGLRLLTGNDKELAEVWDLASHRELDCFTGYAESGSISPDGKYVAIALRDLKKMRLRDVSAQRDAALLEGYRRDMDVSEFSPDGHLLATGGSDHLIRLWRVPSGELVRVLEGHATGIVDLAFAPDGRTLVSSANYDTIKLWQVATGQEMLSFREPSSTYFQFAFSGDGTTLAIRTISEDGSKSLKFWRTPSLEDIAADEARERAGALH
jgi:WD40 repeat protein